MGKPQILDGQFVFELQAFLKSFRSPLRLELDDAHVDVDLKTTTDEPPLQLRLCLWSQNQSKT